MGEKATIGAERAIVGRTAVLLFTRNAAKRKCDVLSVVIEREGRGVSGAYLSRDLHREARSELRESAGAGDTSALPLPLAIARRELARAIVMSRIAGRDVPQWLFTQTDMVGDLHREQGWVEDVYQCGSCSTPLTPAQQVSIARLHGDAPLVDWCPSCTGGDASPTAGDGMMGMSRWRARAWVMLAASEPRRALVYAARAEGAHERGADVDAIKGAAALMLANPVQAVHHLRRAVEKDPAHVRAHGLLVEALTRCGMSAAATASLGVLATAAPSLRPHILRIEQLVAQGRPTVDRAIEHQCLSALTLLDCGRVDQARTLLQPVAASQALPAPGRVAWDALAGGQPPRDIARIATAAADEALSHAVRTLVQAI